jgi:mannosyltransferase
MTARRQIWVLTALLLLAFFLRVWGLDAQSLWYDEGYSAYLGAHLPLDEALDLTVKDIVPPLYYLLLRGWTPLAGSSEYGLRLLSVLFGTLAVALIARIGRYLLESPNEPDAARHAIWSGWLCAALAAISPVLIWLSQDARMYGPLVTWTLLATWGLLRALSATAIRARRLGWALFVGAGLAALYTHTVSAFWLVGQGTFALLVLGWRWRQRPFVRDGLFALGLLALGYLPWLLVASLSYGSNAGYWPGYLPPAHLWRFAWETFVGGAGLSAAQTGLAVFWFGAVALLSGGILLFQRPRAAIYLGCYLALPLLAMGFAFRHTPKLAARYPTAMAPALLLLAAAGAVGSFRLGRPGRYASGVLLAGITVFSLVGDVQLTTRPEFGKDNWRDAVTYLQAHRKPDEAVLLISGHAFPVFAYYYGWEGWEPLPDDVQLDVRHVLDYASVAPRLNETLQDARGVWLVLWQEEVVDPTGLVPALLAEIGREVPAPAFPGATAGDAVRLRHFELLEAARFPDALPVQHAIDETAAPGLLARGYSLPVSIPGCVGDVVPADAEITLRVFWEATDVLQGAYAASLRVADRWGQEWARRDALLAGTYFAERWPVGKPVMGTYTMTMPLGTPPGTYQPELMVYRGAETFATLQLEPLVITRPLTMTQPAALELPAVAPAQGVAVSDPGGQLDLVGAGFDQQLVTPCQDWSLTLGWQLTGRLEHTYGLRLTAGAAQVETTLAPDYPTTAWQSGDVWRSRHRLPISCRALDGTFPVTVQLLDELGQAVDHVLNLGEITVVAGRQFSVPVDLTRVLEVNLPDVGTLVGYRLDQEQVQPGGNLQVALYWRADRETDRNYSVFVHLESDKVWAQHDSWPAEGAKPTSTWARGEIITDLHPIALDQDVPSGSFRLLVGMYDAESMAPLTAIDAQGHLIEGGRILLQPIMVDGP